MPTGTLDLCDCPSCQGAQRFCGGKGGRPGPCPKDEHAAATIHHRAARVRQALAAARLKTAQAAHAQGSTKRTAAALAKAKAAHLQATNEVGQRAAKLKPAASPAKRTRTPIGRPKPGSVRRVAGVPPRDVTQYDLPDRAEPRPRQPLKARLEHLERAEKATGIRHEDRVVNQLLALPGYTPRLAGFDRERHRQAVLDVARHGASARPENRSLVKAVRQDALDFLKSQPANPKAVNPQARHALAAVAEGGHGHLTYPEFLGRLHGIGKAARKHAEAWDTRRLAREVLTASLRRRAGATLVCFSESGAKAQVRGVEIFATGEHRGKEYGPEDLAQMVRNFARYSSGPRPLVKVPVVIGHEEKQPLVGEESGAAAAELENSGIPKFGRPTRVWQETVRCPVCAGRGKTNDEDGLACPSCKGSGQIDVLKSDWAEVPGWLARLIQARAYDKVSAEVYDDPPDGVPGKGRMLRRIALLGGELPQIKTLADVPAPEFAEQCGRAHWRPVVFRFGSIQPGQAAGAFTCFSEVSPMSRDEMNAALQELGFSEEVVKTLSDQQAAEILRVYGTDEDAEEHDEEGKTGVEATLPTKQGEGDAMNKDTLGTVSDYSDEELAQLPPEKKAEVYKARYDEACKKMADLEKDPKPSQVTMKYSEKKLRTLIKSMLGEAIQSEVKPAIDQFRSFSEEQLASQKLLAVDAFCESRLKAGKISARELDTGDARNPQPTLRDRLLRADSKTVVRKYKEKGGKEVELTELDLQMREIDARTPFFFGERLPGKGASKTSDDTEVAKVEEHYESFSETFSKLGTSKDDLVGAFKARRKRDPEFTAEKFLHGASVSGPRQRVAV